MAPILVISVLLLAITGGSSGATWCVCRGDVSDSALQKTLDYACGAGADCSPIISTGACYNPNTLKSHCSYAANSYFQRKGQAQGTCDFSATAITTTTDPGLGTSCTYPSTTSSAGTSPPTTTSPSPPGSTTITPPSSLTPTFSGGISNGLGPSTGTGGLGNTDSNGGFLAKAHLGHLSLALFFGGFLLVRG